MPPDAAATPPALRSPRLGPPKPVFQVGQRLLHPVVRGCEPTRGVTVARSASPLSGGILPLPTCECKRLFGFFFGSLEILAMTSIQAEGFRAEALRPLSDHPAARHEVFSKPGRSTPLSGRASQAPHQARGDDAGTAASGWPHAFAWQSGQSAWMRSNRIHVGTVDGIPGCQVESWPTAPPIGPKARPRRVTAWPANLRATTA